MSGCQGAVDEADGAGPKQREEPAEVARRGRDAAEGHPAERREQGRAEERDGADRDDGESPERDRADASAILAELAPQLRAAGSGSSDLEFSEGLPEPPQPQVVPAPAPWTPAPGSDAAAKPVIEDVWPDKGPASGGERIVIRGKNLSAAQVVFGLSPARILGISDSRDALTVAAPPCEAGAVAIVVTNGDGNYALSKGTFQYYE